jgi:hypothetical protein
MASIILRELSEDDFREMISSIVEDRVSAILNKKHVDDDSEKLLSPKEAVKLFTPEISTKTISNWTKLKLIPVQKVGRKVFYKKSDVLNAANNIRKYHRS